jgi:CheY-like chemotaxis protein
MPGSSVESKPLTILLIDDDQVSREVMAALLTSDGYSVRTAVDGAAALEMLDATGFKPDAILVDARMPGMEETPLISELRDRSKAKIILVSGSNPPGNIAAAADGFLLKPFAAGAVTALLKQQSAPVCEPAEIPAEIQAEIPAEIIDTPVISAETLASLRALMPEPAVREIYQTLVSDLTRRIRALHAAIAAGDAAEVSRIGHAIKGGCGMAGALEASRVGALLENVAQDAARRQESIDNSVSLLRRLRTAVRNLEVMLEEQLP